jgi:ArsR family metal-binding transcriptional regulator
MSRFWYADPTFYKLELDQAEKRKEWSAIVNTAVVVHNEKPAPLEKTKFCSIGHSNFETEQFCEECGEQL